METESVFGTYESVYGTYELVYGTYDLVYGTYESVYGTFVKQSNNNNTIANVVFLVPQYPD